MPSRSTWVMRWFERDPHCWYCGCELILVWDCIGPAPRNLATFDHRYSRNNPVAATGSRYAAGGLLSCHACNLDRGYWGALLTKHGCRRPYEPESQGA